LRALSRFATKNQDSTDREHGGAAMTKGYVYILTNEAMPGLVKIGKTTRDPASRALELHQTGVPFPFTVAHSVFAPDCHDLERSVHDAMTLCRLRPDREFFQCELDVAIAALEDCHTSQVELWLDEFMPDHSPIKLEEIVDMANTSYLAFQHGIHAFQMVDAFSYLTADDVTGAVERAMAAQKARIAKREAVRVIRIGGEE